MWTTTQQLLLKSAIKLAPKIGKKVLTNLMGKKSSKVIYHRNEGINSNIICFIHGFNGNPKNTFGEFPKLITEEQQLNGWDVVSIGYATDIMPTLGLKLWAGKPDLNKVANYMISNLNYLLSSYKRVAFIAHSMGGLVVQKAMLNLDSNDKQRIKYIMLYGTPSNGLKKATLGRWYNNQIADMDKEGSFIKDLRTGWEQAFSNTPPFKFVTVAGLQDEFVPQESSLTPFDKQFHAYSPGNHIDMVKPDNASHPSFMILKTALSERSDKPYLQVFNDQQLNNIVGKYIEIESSLKARLDDLDDRTFEEYIFALEGSQDVEKTIEALKVDSRIKVNTNFMGILGGRYKRKYLAGGSQSSLEQALEWYQKGYDIAKNNTKLHQIYYHGINLAFLYLTGYDDRDKMKEFAQSALDAADKDDRDDLWEAATIAEAYLYLNNFPRAKIDYALAIKKAGSDKRAISSIYLNAHHACTALKKNDWAKSVEQLFGVI